jgi:hypothetical protein
MLFERFDWIQFVLVGVPFLVNFVIHLTCAVVISDDATNLEQSGRKTKLLGRVQWSLIGLCTGLLGLIAYWVVNRLESKP